jgi:hypothetical protein
MCNSIHLNRVHFINGHTKERVIIWKRSLFLIYLKDTQNVVIVKQEKQYLVKDLTLQLSDVNYLNTPHPSHHY